MSTTKFLLTNLNCAACGKVSQMKLSKIAGVASIHLEQNGNEASGELEADRAIATEELQQALAGTDYKVQAV